MNNFTPSEDLLNLSKKVEITLSEKRYRHTLGVASASVRLGAYFLPNKLNELYAAALLHDIAKELDIEATRELLSVVTPPLSCEDLAIPAAFHSLVAPVIIKRDFPLYASEEILTAVYEHTLGNPNMSLFSKIIFLADYIEDGRTYPACRNVADFVYSALESCKIERTTVLNQGILKVLENTEAFLENHGQKIHSRLTLTKNSLIGLI